MTSVRPMLVSLYHKNTYKILKKKTAVKSQSKASSNRCALMIEVEPGHFAIPAECRASYMAMGKCAKCGNTKAPAECWVRWVTIWRSIFKPWKWRENTEKRNRSATHCDKWSRNIYNFCWKMPVWNYIDRRCRIYLTTNIGNRFASKVSTVMHIRHGRTYGDISMLWAPDPFWKIGEIQIACGWWDRHHDKSNGIAISHGLHVMGCPMGILCCPTGILGIPWVYHGIPKTDQKLLRMSCGSKWQSPNISSSKCPPLGGYPLVNIQKTMEHHHFQWENPL